MFVMLQCIMGSWAQEHYIQVAHVDCFIVYRLTSRGLMEGINAEKIVIKKYN